MIIWNKIIIMKMKRVKFERYVKEFWAMSLEYIASICQKMRRGLHYSKELASRIETTLSIYESRKSDRTRLKIWRDV